MKISEIDENLCKSILRPRNKSGNKGTFGKAYLIVGSDEYPGAGIMASIGALRSGVGIVTLAFPDSLKGNLPFKIFPEITVVFSFCLC